MSGGPQGIWHVPVSPAGRGHLLLLSPWVTFGQLWATVPGVPDPAVSPQEGTPFKESLSEVQESSLELLKDLGDIINAIVGSLDRCPLPMRVAFKQLLR